MDEVAARPSVHSAVVGVALFCPYSWLSGSRRWRGFRRAIAMMRAGSGNRLIEAGLRARLELIAADRRDRLVLGADPLGPLVAVLRRNQLDPHGLGNGSRRADDGFVGALAVARL